MFLVTHMDCGPRTWPMQSQHWVLRQLITHTCMQYTLHSCRKAQAAFGIDRKPFWQYISSLL